MTGGMIQGGWEYVWAAYALTGVMLAGYTASILMRLRGERERVRREASEAGKETA